jgi:aspartate dehydrogenase
MEDHVPVKTALIGYGAIAQEICAASGPSAPFEVRQVLVRPERLAQVAGQLPAGTSAIATLDELAPDIDIVLECAGHAAVRQFGPICLSRGIDFGLVSAGVLADAALLENLQETARGSVARMVVVPGAIGGIDALAAAGEGLEHVLYTGRKPPQSWAGSPAEARFDLAKIDRPTPVFEGTARAAAVAFPKNANVVATVALAGIGFERTEVTLVADPNATGNTHEIVATGSQFKFDYKTSGTALPANPKTSALTALSAMRVLAHRGAGLIV